MFTSKRHHEIINLLEKNEQMTTKELSKILNASPTTVRSDLNHLESLNLIHKFHGGAALIKKKDKNIIDDLAFSKRESLNYKEKNLIAEEALKHIKEEQCILLDASSTSLVLSKKLNKFQKLTVVTNGIYNMLVLKEFSNINVIFIGGVVTKDSGSIEGILGKEILDKISADTVFFSAHGFNESEGATDFNIYEVSLKKLMVGRARKKIALIDSSKLGNTSVASFSSFSDIDLLITDKSADKELLKSYEKLSLKISIV